jgi:hypothetical protein
VKASRFYEILSRSKTSIENAIVNPHGPTSTGVFDMPAGFYKS